MNNVKVLRIPITTLLRMCRRAGVELPLDTSIQRIDVAPNQGLILLLESDEFPEWEPLTAMDALEIPGVPT